MMRNHRLRASEGSHRISCSWAFVGQVNSKLGEPDDRGLFSMRRSAEVTTARYIAQVRRAGSVAEAQY
jgi:hypothetical protein